MIKTYINIDPNLNYPTEGMKVKELGTGRIATITGVYEEDDQVWMVSGNDVGLFSLSEFWQCFEEVKV